MANKEGNKLTALANALANTMKELDGTHSFVTSMCKTINATFKGTEIGDDDRAFLTTEVARIRKWSAKSASARISELKAILKAYDKLPEAIAKAVSKGADVPFYKAVTLARSINKGMTANQAAMALKKGPAAAVDPSEVPKADALKKAKTSINSLLKYRNLPSAFRSELRTLAEDHGIEL